MLGIKNKRDIRENIDGLLFVLPYFIFFLFFLMYPILDGLRISLHNWNILGEPKFLGLSNYIKLFQDEVFWLSLKNTIIFAVMNAPLQIIISLLIAIGLNRKFRGKTLLRSIYFFPYLLSISVAATVWIWLLQNRYGLLNYYLRLIGINAPNWLSSPDYAMPAIVITTVWWTIGFNLIIFMAGLQDIPEQLYEAARIDGANKWQLFKNITIPGLSRTFKFVIIMQFISSLKIFGQVYQMTDGGPYGSTRVLIMYLYEQGFRYYRMGYASAIGYIFFLIVFILTLIQWKIMGTNKA